jgi:hypothetical protein
MTKQQMMIQHDQAADDDPAQLTIAVLPLSSLSTNAR